MFRWLQATMWIHVVENFTTSSNDHAWSDNSTGLLVEFFWMEMDPESGIQCQCPCQFLEGHIIWCICWDVPHLHHRFCWNLPATTHSRTMFGLFLWRAHLKLNCKLLGSGGKVHVLIQFRTIHDIWFPINISFLYPSRHVCCLLHIYRSQLTITSNRNMKDINYWMSQKTSQRLRLYYTWDCWEISWLLEPFRWLEVCRCAKWLGCHLQGSPVWKGMGFVGTRDTME